MFEVGFWEITVILVVALVVVGPERLPGLARTVGLWLGKARRFVASVKADIDRELKTEELKRLLDRQAEDISQLREMLDETKAAISPEHLIEPVEKRSVGPPAMPAEGSRKPSIASASPAVNSQEQEPESPPPHGVP
jgi:sec-independent protein translocase protein TatB